MRSVFLISVLAVFASCGSANYVPYDSFSSHGYSETKISQNKYSVTFQGNGHSQPSEVYGFFLKRAAELAKENGHSNFTVKNGAPGQKLNGPVSWPNYSGLVSFGANSSGDEYIVDEVLNR